ncbi:MAG TPA: T3SS effector HopA1 family protein [Longimicrobium sp.]|nr:T3SS effector HopA1 family protein [Longimicrobium sp.]
MNPEPIHPDLRAAVEAVRVESPTGFRFLGRWHELPPPPSAEAATPALLESLAGALYSGLYVRPRPAPGADPAAAWELGAALSAANTGHGTWEPGWTVAGVEPNGTVAVRRDGVTYYAPAHGVRTDGPPAPGGPCRVRVGKELRHLLPGFYFAYGDAPGDGRPVVRLYWNLLPSAAVPFLACVTSRLNEAGLPFRAKVPSDPSGYGRADGGVLYLERADWPRARAVVARVHAEVAAGLDPAVPLFTLRLRDGLGVAEDPGPGRSFGQVRCALAARGAWAAWNEGAEEGEERVRVMAAVFRAAGIDPARPYLEPGGEDVYRLDALPGVRIAPAAPAPAEVA